MDYFSMDREGLVKEQQLLQDELARFQKMGLKLDMSRGKPGSNQLDLSLDLLSIKDYKDETGVDARNYGNLEGLPEARRFFAPLLGVQPEETFVGGNASLELMYHLLNMAWHTGWQNCKPWKDCGKIKFLCPSPGYDRHFRIAETFGFELVSVPMLSTGPDMDEVEKLVQDEAVKGIWCVPVYSNPDGYTYSDNTTRRLAQMNTAAPDFRIFWDNAYGVHHLYDVHEKTLNILDECRNAGNENRPLIFFSTSKITFAGAGVGAMGMSITNLQNVSKYIFPMTIGFDKMNQLRHIRFLQQQGGVAAHMKKHAAILVPKFEIVLDALQLKLAPYGEVARWTKPRGGYFISLFTLKGCAKRVVELCKEAGVVLTGAGAAYPYGVDPDDHHIRIAPTFPPLDELKTAAELLCITVRLASVEALLAN